MESLISKGVIRNRKLPLAQAKPEEIKTTFGKEGVTNYKMAPIGSAGEEIHIQAHFDIYQIKNIPKEVKI